MNTDKEYAKRRCASAMRFFEDWNCGAGFFDIHSVTYDPFQDICIVVASADYPEFNCRKTVVVIIDRLMHYKEIWPDRKEAWHDADGEEVKRKNGKDRTGDGRGEEIGTKGSNSPRDGEETRR